MSRIQPTLVEERELEFTCNRCLAKPGGWCTAAGWPVHYASELHILRFYSATRAGRLPIAPADFCQPCARVTASQPCPGCGQPACAACRNCPACDLDPLTEAVLTNARILRERREAGDA